MSSQQLMVDGLWKLYLDNHNYVRHHEVQRSTVATVIISIASALLAVATFDKALTIHDAPILVMVIAIGVFGVFFSLKQFERTCMHVHRADLLLHHIQIRIGHGSLLRIVRAAESRHRRGIIRTVGTRRRKPFKLRLVGVHHFWVVFYSLIGAIGALLLFIAIKGWMVGG
jgi:hypothetical protein